MWQSCGLRWVEVWAREQMQPAIHALRAVADSSVKHDGVADNPASLSVPWLAGWVAAWVCSLPLLFTRKLNESLDPTGADRQPSTTVNIRRKNFVNAKQWAAILRQTRGAKNNLVVRRANNVRPFRCSSARAVCHRQWLRRIFLGCCLCGPASKQATHQERVSGMLFTGLLVFLSTPPSKTYSVFVCVGIRQEHHFIVYLMRECVMNKRKMERMRDFNWPKVPKLRLPWLVRQRRADCLN